MSRQNRDKLNSLLKEWPPGTVMVYRQLKKYGIYQQLVNKYVKSGWLKPIGRGAFIREGSKVDWTGALYAIQTQLGLSIHVGGITAFELMSATHFVRIKHEGTIWLFGEKTAKLPSWFIKDALNKWQQNIVFVQTRIFDFSDDSSVGLLEYQCGDYSILISSKERAILEILSLVPHKISLIEAKYIAEGLLIIRPKIIQQFLEHCNSIKVKRLFLFLADFCNLPCLEELDISKIDLGKGKRIIGEGGHYVPKYLISIPHHFVHTFYEEFQNNEQ